jgi:hypothetical protein
MKIARILFVLFTAHSGIWSVGLMESMGPLNTMRVVVKVSGRGILKLKKPSISAELRL